MYNFSPGPGALFPDVLNHVQNEMMNWKNSGISILELNHRTPEFKSLLMNTKHKLRLLMNIPAQYEILFLQGGATQFFSTIPLNFTNKTDTVDYIVNGSWSDYAAKEACKFCNVNISNISNFNDYTICPDQKDLDILSESKYVHYCDNETIHGCEFDYVPDVGNKPLICDMSSNFLSKPIDVTKFALIYAGSHKNIGPAGMVLVVIKKDMLKNNKNNIPTMLNLTEICEHNSMLNTPPIFPIYVAGLTFKKILDIGGIYEIEKGRNIKAQMLYNTIEQSCGFYTYKMKKQYRSKINVPFELKNKKLESKFIEQARSNGIIGLNGHHILGHCRASLYNAMTINGVFNLCDFMINFMLNNVN